MWCEEHPGTIQHTQRPSRIHRAIEGSTGRGQTSPGRELTNQESVNHACINGVYQEMYGSRSTRGNSLCERGIIS